VIALPITFLYFKARATQEGVLTTWATTSQWNSAYFIIEKSKNGVDWEEVGRLKSSNGMGVEKEYNLLDQDPYQGGSYYRLVEISSEGKRTPYAVDYVHIDSQGVELFLVYPNPTTGDLNVKIVGEEVGYEFTLVDLLGRIIVSEKLSVGLNSLGSVLSSPGIYIARLKIRADYKTLKVVKQ
jgi:hypothetical protein